MFDNSNNELLIYSRGITTPSSQILSTNVTTFDNNMSIDSTSIKLGSRDLFFSLPQVILPQILLCLAISLAFIQTFQKI